MRGRRTFLRGSAGLLLGGLGVAAHAQSALVELGARPVGLQLFTLFNTFDQDVKGNLRQLANIGYRELESAFSMKGGFYGLKPRAFAAMVADQGMTWKSHHVLGAPFVMPPDAKPLLDAAGKPLVLPRMRNLRDDMQSLVDEVAEGGASYLVCASTPTGSVDEVERSIEVLNKSGEACRKAGLTLAYHNHDVEFRKLGATTPYEMLLKGTNADTVKMELDLCWATKAGVDPVELFKRHPGRFHLWHVKDIDRQLRTPLALGEGIIDFKRIFAHAATAGMRHYFVEHDMPADPMASVTTSFAYLKTILK